MKVELQAKGAFDLKSVVFSHGWADLAPFRVLKSNGAIRLGLRTSRGPVTVTISSSPNGLAVEYDSAAPKIEIEKSIRHIFRLDDDLSEFYRAVANDGRSWLEPMRMGRLLRSQSVFEDLVKLILTTNCSWSFTRIMTDRLAEMLGEPMGEGIRLFPSPEQVASKTEKFYRDKIRAGYRSPHLPLLAKRVLKGDLDPNSWLDPKRPTEDVRKEILSVPGAGPYVADNLLKFLGRYDRLGLDSWARGTLKRLWKMKKIPADKTIERNYKKFGEYKGLVLWCDLTRDWFESDRFSDWIRER